MEPALLTVAIVDALEGLVTETPPEVLQLLKVYPDGTLAVTV
jgi:hypothetical protein